MSNAIDLRIDHRDNAAGVIDLALRPVPLTPAERGARPDALLHDLDTLDGRDLLAQAVWLRLAIPRGELAHLGHPDFGSRLHRLIGRRMSAATLALAEAYVREALRREPLIAGITALSITGDPLTSRLDIAVQVQPAAGAPLDLALTLALDGAPPA
ncbi:hypothetical protein [Thiohalocapsa sp. ML1]|uniref:hypothetical protein n=1 Tax=Thiohalocapsa sp. ML1 TaxID=1431688 RepID=UPI0007322DCA|nr:hypothetical protein [Thiohalocapsa sp. ML1]